MTSTFYERPHYHFPGLVKAPIEISHPFETAEEALITLNQQDETSAEVLVHTLQQNPIVHWANVKRAQPQDPFIQVQFAVDASDDDDHRSPKAEAVLIDSLRSIDHMWTHCIARVQAL